MRRYLDGRAMDDVAIERLRSFEEQALSMHSGGYWLAFSGGKDSVVILDLAERAKVTFEAWYNLTTCDPPEVVYFVRTFPNVKVNKPPKSMWQLIRDKGGMPTPMRPWYCYELKERSGEGRVVITGVRAEESRARAGRQVVEKCFRRDKTVLNPIVDWSIGDVWDYINERQLPSCCLYAEGAKRLGCVCCPKARKFKEESARWPKIAAAWKRACFVAWHARPKRQANFPTPEAMWEWWVAGCVGAYAPDEDRGRLLFEHRTVKEKRE